MKKLLLITILCAFALSNLNAQIGTSKTLRNTQSLDQAIPPPPPPTNSKTSGPISNTDVSTSVYSLTSVRVNIRTGNDNKEFPSVVRVSVSVRGGNMEYAYFLQDNLKNEMKSNSNTEFGLEKSKGYLKDITLDVLQNTGIHLQISYTANFQLDAWKIEGVSATIEFRDQNGNLHPTLGHKTISFSNANGFLNGYPGSYYMRCNTDGYFNPLSAYIE
jgi:hypothetical protein